MPHKSGLLAMVVCAWMAPEAMAQTCRTLNCGAPGLAPADCRDRARPRTQRVLMTSALVFSPEQPRIEPDDCIEWVTSSGFISHSSTDGDCPDTGTTCNSPVPAACEWETGNVSQAGGSVVCHYDRSRWPPATSDPYFCRIHIGMSGTLQVTTGIVLRVAADEATGDVVLTWTGGGIPGTESFKVVRSDARDFVVSTTLDPTGGATSRTFRDVDELGGGITRFYLIRNRQPNE